MNSFGKIDLIKEAWNLLKANIPLFLKVFGVYLIYYIAQYGLTAYFKYNVAGGLISLIFSIVAIVLELGLIYLSLKLIDGESPTIIDLYSYPNLPKKVLKTFIASILYGITVILGLILFVIPGIYIAIRGMFFSYYIVDKDAGIMDSIKMSWNSTKGGVLNLFLFDLLLIGLNILGALVFGIGLFVTVPVSLLSVALLYRKFQK